MIGKGLDVTPMEAFFLMILNNRTSLSGAEIVQYIKENLGMNWTPSPGATYKILQSMEKKEYIKETTEESREDQRIRTYDLTKKGKEILPIITKRILKIALFADNCCAGIIDEKGSTIRVIRLDETKEC